MNCSYCNKNLTSCNNPLFRVKETFCDTVCMESFYLKKIEILELSIKKWKNAWWEQRDIIGKHGLKIMRYEHPSYFKEDMNEKG